MKPHILIATPMHSQQVWFSYHRSLLATMIALPRVGIESTDGTVLGCCSIPHARCQLQAQFLNNPQFTHLMWIDSDMGWDWRDLVRMLKADRRLVAGVYQTRTDHPSFPVSFTTNDPVMDADGCVEAETIQGGFVLIRRDMIEHITRAFPERRVKLHDGEFDHPQNLNCYDFYPLSIAQNGLMQTDDGGFSRLYREAGGTLYVMPDVRLTHSGAKDFSACLTDFVKFRQQQAA